MEHDERLVILKGLPKLDLHRHLEGSIRITTMLELGRKHGLDLPLDSLVSLAPLVSNVEGEPRTLQQFLSKFHCEWYRSYADVERIADEIVTDAFEEGVVYLELRFSPEHLTRTSRLELPGVMKAVTESALATAAELGIGVRFIITLVRERYDLELWKRMIDRAAEMSEQGVVGVDLAGDEFDHPNSRFERAFARVRDTGVLGVTIHAGEGTSAAQVASAVKLLGATRIGHGLKAVEDEKVVKVLAKRRVTLEMCPTSNFQTGCLDDLERHPLPVLDRLGVPVTLNSDDPCIQHGTINDEYDVAVTCWGYSLNDLLRLERNAVGAAFLPEEEKDVLLERVEKGYQECCGQGLA